MNTRNHSLALEQRVDAALARLPEWQAPPDFAARLAAAAARQATSARHAKQEPAWVVALEALNSVVPTALWSATAATVLAWIVPWSQLLAGNELIWACGAVMGAAGLILTLRVLRAP